MSSYHELLALSVYRGVIRRPVGSALLNAVKAFSGGSTEQQLDAMGALAEVLSRTGQLHSILAALAAEVLSEENALTVTAAGHQELPAETLAAAKRDLAVRRVVKTEH